MTLPTVSIVVPSFNQARFLEEALGSLLQQRDQIHELIVMDGGSTDGSKEIIERHQSAFTHWQSEKDDGQAGAIINGFERASGDILAWVNSDDALLPGAVRSMREAFASNPQSGMIEGNTVIIDQESMVIRCDRRAGPSHTWARFGYMRVHQPSTFFRRSLYEQVGGIDRSMHCTMDTDLWYRMLPAANALRLNRYIGVHRIHTDAKGENEAWKAKYAEERTILDERYPHYRNNPIHHQLGRIAYYTTQFFNGRASNAKRDTKAMTERTLAESVNLNLLDR